MNEPACRCGGPLTIPDTGRRPRYCSTACRRSAEYQLRREQTLLLRAQKAEQDARLKAETTGRPQDIVAAEWWRVEVERLEEWLEHSLIFEAEDQ